MKTYAWETEMLDASERPSNDLIEDLLHGHVPAAVVPDVLTTEQCAEATARLENKQPTSYSGIELQWALPEDKQGPGHWEIKYQGKSWADNIKAAPKIDAAIAEVFGDLGHPRTVFEKLLGNWAHGRVGSLIHPVYGAPVIAGQLRRGAPDAHVDDVNFDSAIARSHGQIGANIILSNPEDGDLEVFNMLWNRPGNRAGAGSEFIGNYAIPREEYENAPRVVVPCRPGSVVLVSNRFVHRVQRVTRPADRLTFALHGAWLTTGQLALFS